MNNRGNYSFLPIPLLELAYWGSGEAAWATSEALAVVEACQSNKVAIIGAEVWLPTQPGPTIPSPSIYSWQCTDRILGEHWISYINRSSLEAREFISDFRWSDKDQNRYKLPPYFNLTFLQELNLQ